jgi:hypothetical protein
MSRPLFRLAGRAGRSILSALEEETIAAGTAGMEEWIKKAELNAH